MKKLLFICIAFLMASCSSEPSSPFSQKMPMKVILIERCTDSTSLYHINMDGQGSEFLIRIEERNGFASVGDPVGLLNLNAKNVKQVPLSLPVKDTVVKETNKSLK